MSFNNHNEEPLFKTTSCWMWLNQSFITARKEVLFLLLIALIITTFILVMSVALCFYFREKLNGIKVFIPRQSLLT